MSSLTLGSLFSGSGGFELAALIAGIKPIWASEIEPFPIRVTRKNMPFLKHLGDINKINGGEIEPVDIITFGSPCQDMSIAGKRKGLGGSKSSLFYEAIRIIKEMREKTNGEKPRYIVWENVKGAFSSNKGDDFKKVLEEIISVKEKRVSISKPKKWTNAGSIKGVGFSAAWRVLDAQYFGVPQRRKRIFLVADFNGECAEEVLFIEKGLRGDFKKSKKEKERDTGSFEKSPRKTGSICLNDQGGDRMDLSYDMTSTLRSSSNHPPLVFENHSQDSRYKGPEKTAQTILSTFGTGGNNQPFVLETYDLRLTSENTKNHRANIYKTSTSRTIDSSGNSPSSNQGGVAVLSIQGSMIGRKDENGPKGLGINKDISFTLNKVDRHACCYSIDRASFNASDKFARDLSIEKGGVAPSLIARGPSAVGVKTYAASKSSFFTNASFDLANSLVATDHKDPQIVSDLSENEYIVRRLTPTECGRLQGFPDYWCDGLNVDNPSMDEVLFFRDVFEEYRLNVTKGKKAKTINQIISWLKKPHSDSAEYKMWGNGVALPCVVFIMENIKICHDLTKR